MPWTPPVNPVPDTVITSAYAIANILDPLRWLRLITGNSDPPGADYTLVSGGTASVTWGKITAAVMAAGAVVAHLGYTPANVAGQTFTGNVSAPNLTASPGSISAPTGAISAGGNVSSGAAAGLIAGTGGVSSAGIIATSSTSSGSIQTPGGISAGGSIAATGQVSGGSFGAIHSTGTILADGAITTTYTGATALDVRGGASVSLGLAVGGNASIGGSVSGGQYTSSVGGGTGIPPFVVSSSALVDNLNVLLHNGARASVTPSAGYIPIADASGKLDAWVTAGGGGGGSVGFSFPLGVIAFIPDSAIPAGFSFYTPANGRVIVGAGTAGVTNPQSFTAGANGGASDWSHAHAGCSFGVTAGGTATGGPSDNTGGPNATGGTVSGTPPPSFGTNLHTHSLNGVSFAVSVSGTASGNTSGAIWVPPSHALNAIRRTS